MKHFVAALSMAAALAATVVVSHAEFDASSCFSGCTTEEAECMAKIDALNETELRDQRAVCNSAKSECFNRCDAERENDLRLRRENPGQPEAPPQQDQPPQEDQ